MTEANLFPFYQTTDHAQPTCGAVLGCSFQPSRLEQLMGQGWGSYLLRLREKLLLRGDLEPENKM